MKNNWVIILFICLGQHLSAQLTTYTFEQVDSLSVSQPKPTVVFLHTEWCKYCEVMENTTFKNKELINRLNSNYYFISFDAESKESVKFQNRTFSYKPSGRKTGIHELAEALGRYQNKLSYPTTVVLNTKNEIVFQYPSMLRSKGFLRLLNAIQENEKL